MNQPSKIGGLTSLVTRLTGGTAEVNVATEPEAPALRVTSHVARDLLQNAAYFNSVPKAVAEYVTNAIDNALPSAVCKPFITPLCQTGKRRQSTNKMQ
jgi:hypothetical protein